MTFGSSNMTFDIKCFPQKVSINIWSRKAANLSVSLPCGGLCPPAARDASRPGSPQSSLSPSLPLNSTAAGNQLHYVPQHCNCSSMDLVRVYCITSALYVEHCRMFGKRAKDRKSTDKNVALVECSCNAGELHCKGFEEGGRVVIAASCPSQVSVLCPGLIL